MTPKLPSKLERMIPSSLAAISLGGVAAAANGMGITSVMPDGIAVTDTLPTYAASAISFLVAAIVGSSQYRSAVLAPPVDENGKASARHTMSILIGQAFREGEREIVEACSKLVGPKPQSTEEQLADLQKKIANAADPKAGGAA